MKRALLLAGLLLLTACGGASTPSLLSSPSTSATTTPSASPSPSPSPGSALAGVRLTGDGIDLPEGVVSFGDDYTDVRGRLDARLGTPTRDTGEVESSSVYGPCPGSTLRALEYGGGALRLLFGDVIGPGLTLYQWTLADTGQPDQVPQASAFVGDVTTFEFTVGTSIKQLRDGIPADMLEVIPPSDPFDASFTVKDQSSGFFGTLTGTTPADTVTSAQAGEGCGE